MSCRPWPLWITTVGRVPIAVDGGVDECLGLGDVGEPARLDVKVQRRCGQACDVTLIHPASTLAHRPGGGVREDQTRAQASPATSPAWRAVVTCALNTSGNRAAADGDEVFAVVAQDGQHLSHRKGLPWNTATVGPVPDTQVNAGCTSASDGLAGVATTGVGQAVNIIGRTNRTPSESR